MNLKKLKTKEKRYSVKLGESLYLRVSPSGCKSFVLRYAHLGRVKDITLGHYPDLTLLQARQLAHLKREELKIKPSLGVTFRDAFKLWKDKKKGNIASYHDEVKRIEQYLVPKLNNLELEAITAPLALNLLLELKGKLPTLKRVLMRLNEILELAVCAGLLSSNPCRKLSKVFANHTPVNRPFIRAERLSELFALLKGQELWFHAYVLWCVYSMLRPIEACSVKWSWIDNDVLTLPAFIMKKRRAHRVPLCSDVLTLITYVRHVYKRKSQHVWPFGRYHKPINKQHLSKWLCSTPLKGQLCHHGLRATARTWLKDNNVTHEIAEDCLAHLTGSTTERAYLRGDYLEQRREVMLNWWNYLFSLYCASCAGDTVADELIQAVAKVKREN